MISSKAWATSSVLTVAVGLALAAQGQTLAAPGDAQPGSGCEAWQVEYALSANLTLRDTPNGSGDGTYRVGPGHAVLLFEGPDQRQVQLLAYVMRDRFTMHPSSPFGSANIDVDLTTETAQGCGVAYGVMSGPTLSWTSRVRGYRSDGTTTCEGWLCGKFGAPAQGQAPWRMVPQNVPFGPFTFGADGKTFTMPSTFVETSKDPKQTAYVALSGREVRRTCVPPTTCR